MPWFLNSFVHSSDHFLRTDFEQWNYEWKTVSFLEATRTFQDPYSHCIYTAFSFSQTPKRPDLGKVIDSAGELIIHLNWSVQKAPESLQE